MARRRRKTQNNPKIILGVIALLGILWLTVQLAEHPAFPFALLVVAIAVIVYLKNKRNNARRLLFQAVHLRVDHHLQTLIVRRAQLVRRDPYGKVQTSKWEKELSGFITDQVAPFIAKDQLKLLVKERESVTAFIDARVNEAAQTQPAFTAFDESMQPSEFEVFCAEELRRAGWDARVTTQSRDQGADVVAEKNGLRIAVQCKLYSRPVGNKAVQEVVAARAHQRASYGVVVTNNRYTSAAQQLAGTNRIMLLHYSELRAFDQQLDKFRLQGQRSI